MDVIEAIKSRKSVRAFKAEPVPREVLQAIMEAVLRAPSWANTQPWGFAILGGEAMEKVRTAVADKAGSGDTPNLDIPWPNFEGPYRERMHSAGKRLFQEMGIAREDKEARQNWMLAMTRFFIAATQSTQPSSIQLAGCYPEPSVAPHRSVSAWSVSRPIAKRSRAKVTLAMQHQFS